MKMIGSRPSTRVSSASAGSVPWFPSTLSPPSTRLQLVAGQGGSCDGCDADRARGGRLWSVRAIARDPIGVESVARWPLRPERSTQGRKPGRHRPCDVCLRDARRGLLGFDYGNGPDVPPALRQPPRLPRPHLIDRSGSRRVRFGVDPETGQEGSNTMTNNTQNGAPHGRRERDRDRDSRQRSEAIGAGRSFNARRTDRAGIKADRFGPGDPRYAYLTRTFD